MPGITQRRTIANPAAGENQRPKRRAKQTIAVVVPKTNSVQPRTDETVAKNQGATTRAKESAGAKKRADKVLQKCHLRIPQPG